MNHSKGPEFVGPLQLTVRQALIRRGIAPFKPTKAEHTQLMLLAESRRAAESAIAQIKVSSAIPGIEVTYLDERQ